MKHLTPFMTVTSSTLGERTFAVRYVPAGARYGLGNRLTTDQPLVEFYDTTYADDTADTDQHGFGPLGQFVSRYHPTSLLGEDHSMTGGVGGLLLDGAFREWSVDAESMEKVREWVRETRDRFAAVAAATAEATE